MGTYKLTHTNIVEGETKKSERFFHFQNRAKEAAEKTYGSKLKWKNNTDLIYSTPDGFTVFTLEPIHFER